MEFMPLVSVGIPTYNRPEGLRRTLLQITAQTYANLEIVVSDNCSTMAEVYEVAAHFADIDPRVRIVRQVKPLHVADNFRFVLEQATGEYFMWAADDDEWSPNFVSRCMEPFLADGGASVVAVMSGIQTHCRATGVTKDTVMPEVVAGQGAVDRICAFLQRPTPSLFYSLYRRCSIQFFCLERQWFDFYDCYFISRLMAWGDFVFLRDVLYTAGIDAPTYKIKTSGSIMPSGLGYWGFFSGVLSVVSRMDAFWLGKLRVYVSLALLVARLMVSHEGRAVVTRFCHC